MPSFYSNVQDFTESALGNGLAPYYASLKPGALAREIARASDEADSKCSRTLGIRAVGTVAGSAPLAAGSLSVPVSNATNISPLDVLYFPTTGETVGVAGAQVTSWVTPPYAGTVYLEVPTTHIYNPGDAVTSLNEDKVRIRGKATRPMDGDAGMMTQDAQLNLMHAGRGTAGPSARSIFLPDMPIVSVFAGYQQYPWTAGENKVDLSSIEIDRQRGLLRLPVGFYNPVGCVWRIQYSGGFTILPEDIVDAVHLLTAKRLMRPQNPFGATRMRESDADIHDIGLKYEQEADCLLDDYRLQGMA